MRSISLPPAALGAAIALHLALLVLRTAPPVPERFERIEIRLAAVERPRERQPEPPAAVPPPKPLPRKMPTAVPVRATVPVPAASPPPAPKPLPETVPAKTASSAPTPAPAVIAPAAAEVPQAIPVTSPAVRQEPAPAAVAAPASSAGRLGDFLETVHRAVEEHKEYPSFARQLGQQGRAVVRARILADGRLGEATVILSSGHQSLDKAALAALRRAAPLRSPAEFGLGAVTVEVPIVFRLI